MKIYIFSLISYVKLISYSNLCLNLVKIKISKMKLIDKVYKFLINIFFLLMWRLSYVFFVFYELPMVQVRAYI